MSGGVEDRALGLGEAGRHLREGGPQGQQRRWAEGFRTPADMLPVRRWGTHPLRALIQSTLEP